MHVDVSVLDGEHGELIASYVGAVVESILIHELIPCKGIEGNVTLLEDTGVPEPVIEKIQELALEVIDDDAALLIPGIHDRSIHNGRHVEESLTVADLVDLTVEIAVIYLDYQRNEPPEEDKGYHSEIVMLIDEEAGCCDQRRYDEQHNEGQEHLPDEPVMAVPAEERDLIRIALSALPHKMYSLCSPAVSD